jgi:hypothetical protein
MPAKNTLIATAADLVEGAFKDKLASIQSMQASVEEPAGSVAGDGSARMVSFASGTGGLRRSS